MYTVKIEGAFEAAHRVVGYPGKCDRLHGHNWVVELSLRGTELDPLGMFLDFKVAKRVLGEILKIYDHRFLNELAPFSNGVNPTAENLARIIYEAVEEKEELPKGSLAAVTVFESPKTSVTYTKD